MVLITIIHFENKYIDGDEYAHKKENEKIELEEEKANQTPKKKEDGDKIKKIKRKPRLQKKKTHS